MKKLLIPILLSLIGLGGGIGAGIYLRPGPGDMSADPCGDAAGGGAAAGEAENGHEGAATEKVGAEGQAHAAGGHGKDDAAQGDAEGEGEAAAGPEYVKLNNQFIVPIVEGGAVSALVILSLSLEVKAGSSQDTYAREPKLRDGFLEVLFAHANTGGFSGAFTETGNIDTLRQALLEVAQKTMGERVTDVLITDIVRQDT